MTGTRLALADLGQQSAAIQITYCVAYSLILARQLNRLLDLLRSLGRLIALDIPDLEDLAAANQCTDRHISRVAVEGCPHQPLLERL